MPFRGFPAQRWSFLLVMPLSLSACGVFSGGDFPPQKEQARLEIAIHAARDLNQDLHGRAAPMLLRVYELKADVAFQDADYFALQNADKTVLGPDLLAVDQYVIRPDETRRIQRKTNPETTAIAVFAGYRNLPNATWRVVYKLAPAPAVAWYRAVVPANKAKLKIELQANAILLTDEEKGTPPVQYANESTKGLEKSSLPVNSKGEMGKNSIDAQGVLSNFPEKSMLDVLQKTPLDAIKKIVAPQ